MGARRASLSRRLAKDLSIALLTFSSWQFRHFLSKLFAVVLMSTTRGTTPLPVLSEPSTFERPELLRFIRLLFSGAATSVFLHSKRQNTASLRFTVERKNDRPTS